MTQEWAEPIPGAESRRGNPRSRVLGILRRNSDLLRNAGSLLATTGVTSGFGFLYWIVAAHEFSPEDVGYGSAAISALSLIGTIGMFGLGTMLIGELPQRRSKGPLVAAALGASAIGSLVLGILFALLAGSFGKNYGGVNATLGNVVLFSAGVALTGAALVFDESTIGLLRGGIQLTRNTAFAVAKMALLPVAALVIHSAFGAGLLVSWIAGTLLSLIPVAVMIRRGGSSVLHRPDWGSLRRLTRVTMAHNWLNLSITVPPQLIPVIVAALVAPQQNAVFYVASMITNILFMVPTHLSTVLFAVVSATPEVIAEKLRFVLRLSFAIGIPAVLVMGIGSPLILGFFGSSYAHDGTLVMWLLALGYIPAVPKTQYIAVCRATGQVSKATWVMGLQAAGELAGVLVGGKLDGLTGVCAGMLIVGVAEGLMTTPAVVQAALGRLRMPEPETDPATGPMTAVPEQAAALGLTVVDMPAVPDVPELDFRTRQNAGLAALMAIATSVTTPDPDAYKVITDSFPAVTGPLVRASADPRAETFHADVPTSYDMPAVSDEPGDDDAHHIRQQAGLAALMALSVRPVRF